MAGILHKSQKLGNQKMGVCKGQRYLKKINSKGSNDKRWKRRLSPSEEVAHLHRVHPGECCRRQEVRSFSFKPRWVRETYWNQAQIFTNHRSMRPKLWRHRQELGVTKINTATEPRSAETDLFTRGNWYCRTHSPQQLGWLIFNSQLFDSMLSVLSCHGNWMLYTVLKAWNAEWEGSTVVWCHSLYDTAAIEELWLPSNESFFI